MTKVVSSTSHVDLVQVSDHFTHYQRVTYDPRASVALDVLKILVKGHMSSIAGLEETVPTEKDLVTLSSLAVATSLAFHNFLIDAGMSLHTPPIEDLEALAKEKMLDAAAPASRFPS